MASAQHIHCSMPRRFCKRARPRAARPRGAPPLPPVRAPSGRAAALPSPHPVRTPPRRCRPSACLPAAAARPCPIRTRRSTAISTSRPHSAPPLPPIPTAAVRPRAARPRGAPPLPPVRAPSGRAAALPSPHPVRASLPPLPQHGHSHPPAWPFPPFCFCALVNYHSAVLTNARPPCYAEASAGRGRSAPPRRPAAGNEPGRTLRNPRALPQGTNRGADAPANPAPAAGNEPGADAPANPAPAAPRSPRGAPEGNGPPPCRGKRTGGGRSRTPRRPAAGNEPGRDVPANPAPAVPCSPRGAPEGNGSPPKTNGLRARHRAAGGKEAACSASSCPRCARWRR